MGSEGSKGSARSQRAGSEGCGIALTGDEFFYNAAYRRQGYSATYLPTGHGHPERSEESRYFPIVTHGRVNTGRREEGRGILKVLKVLRFDSRCAARVEAASGPDGPGLPEFCPGPASPPGQVEGLPAQGSYIVSLRWRGGRPSGAILYAAVAALSHQSTIRPLSEANTTLLYNQPRQRRPFHHLREYR